MSISQFYIIFLYIYILQLEKVLLNQATRPQRERPTSEREIQTDVGTGSRGGEEENAEETDSTQRVDSSSSD